MHLRTGRLALRPLTLDDAPFIVVLLNDPGWLRNIGDRGIRTGEDARGYLEKGPLAMYARDGLGLLRVALADSGAPIGMCGLIRRAGLSDVDLGFALLPAYRGEGYACEASRAVIEDGRTRLGLTRLVAIVAPHNTASVTLLERLGFALERRTQMKPGDDVLLYGLALG